MLLPALHAFEPTLLFISAGFDAHSDDLYHFLSEKVWPRPAASKSSLFPPHKPSLPSPPPGLPLAHGAALPHRRHARGQGGVGARGRVQPRRARQGGAFPRHRLFFPAWGLSLTSPSTTPSPCFSAPQSAQASKVRGKKAPVEGDEEGSEGRMFAQQPGDGGLVKGVLAHVSALAGRGSWGR